jgi:hypothetical protein
VALPIVVDEVRSSVNETKLRARRAPNVPFDPTYWASSQSLVDTITLSVLDNPANPTNWLGHLGTLGEVLGRAMAHEVRHLYVPGQAHAATGLGAEAADLLQHKRFSAADEVDILAAIQQLEAQQGTAIVVETNPVARRDGDFPF